MPFFRIFAAVFSFRNACHFLCNSLDKKKKLWYDILNTDYIN